MRSGRRWDLIALSAVVAFCGLLYELILAQSMAAVLGGTIGRYQLTIGTYLAAMGVGAYLASAKRIRSRAAENLWRVEIALSIAGGLSPLLFVELGRVASGTPPVGMLATIVLIGALAGAELPLLIAIAERRAGGKNHGATARILAADYAGMLAAAALFVSFFLPRLGLFGTAWMAGALNALAAAATLALLAGEPREQARPRSRLQVALAVSVVAAITQFGALRSADSLQARIVERAYLGEPVIR